MTDTEATGATDQPASSPRPAPMGSSTDLTVGSILQHLVRFSLPMLAGSIMQTAYSFINAIWVGKGLGEAAMAAVTIGFPVIFVLMAVAMGLTLGAGILVSQAFGAQDITAVRRAVQTSSMTVLAVTLMCVAAGELSASWVLRLMQTPPESFAMAESYLRVFLLTMPAMFGMFLVASLLRGVGDSRTPLVFQAISVVATIGLDPVLMFGWLGAPRLGLTGAAWATLIAQMGALVAMSWVMPKRNPLVTPNLLKPEFHWPTFRMLIRVGVPAMGQQVLFAAGLVVVVGLVNHFGVGVAAAYGAVSRLENITIMPAMTIGMAVSTLAGQNIGAGRFDRVRQVFLWGCILSLAVTGLAVGLVLLLPGLMLRLFLNDPAVVGYGVDYLRIVGWGYLALAVMFVANGIHNGAGHTLVVTIMSFVSLWMVRLPLSYWLSHRLDSPNGLWWGITASMSTGALLAVSYYLSGRWQVRLGRPRE